MQSLFGFKDEDSEVLCRDLYLSDTQNDVVKILKNYGLWENDSYWTDYGNDENNVATIGNQSNNAESALVEKFTNSIDAILLKEARQRGIDPKSPNAPQSINDAMQMFYGVEDANIKTAKPEIFKVLKDQIYLVATGSKNNPTLSIIDKGEGQTPNMLPETILSLQRTNKLEVHFVQGQFNQGGTAVLPYCGTNRLQLVISKRNQDIASKDDDTYDKWGFTIVRRNTTDKHSRHTRYEYLTIDGKVPSFTKESLDLLPGKYPEVHAQKLESGTYIKLYEYNLNIQGYVNTSLNFYLSMLLPGAKIPVSFNERRDWNKAIVERSTTAYLYGHFYRFANSKDALEKGFPYKFAIEIEKQKLEVSVVCFANEKHKSYKKHEGVLFTLNGQTQGIIQDSMFDKKSVGLGYLKKSLMVFIDASKLDTSYREDLFMSDRQRFREGTFFKDIMKFVESELSSNKQLHKLQEKRRKESIQNQIEKSDALNNTMKKLLKTSPSLNILLNTGVEIKSTMEEVSEKLELIKQIGAEFPSYFELEENFDDFYPKRCPINKKFRVKFVTDVEDEYFSREEDRGIYKIWVNGNELHQMSFKLSNLKATLTAELPHEVKVGEKLEYHYEIYNENNSIQSFSGKFTVLVEEEEEKKTNDTSNPKHEHKSLDLPDIQPIYKNDWDKYGFDEFSAVEVISNGRSYDYIINMDNKFLRLECKSNPKDKERIEELYKNALFLSALSMLDGNQNDDNTSTVKETTKALAKVILPMIHLGEVIKA